jgi:hypothetical protein
VFEGETVNVGSLLGTVDNSSLDEQKKSNEVNNYSPPKKKEDKNKLKLFEEEKSTVLKITKAL